MSRLLQQYLNCANIIQKRFDYAVCFKLCVCAFNFFRKPKPSKDTPFSLNICLKEICRNGIMRFMRLLLLCGDSAHCLILIHCTACN